MCGLTLLWPSWSGALPPQRQAADQRLVAGLVLLFQVIEQAPPSPYQHQKPAARVEIFRMRLEMFREVADPLGQQGNLHFGAAGIVGSGRVFANERRATLRRNRHQGSPG